MSQNMASGVRGTVREFFLLERAEQQSAELTTPQRQAIRSQYDAAMRRFSVAGNLRGPGQTPVALSLYRDAWLYLTYGLLISRDVTIDVLSLTPQLAWDGLARVLAMEGTKIPPELETSRPLLLTADPLAFDRLGLEEANHTADALDTGLRWLSGLVDARSPRSLRVTRVVRIATAVAAAATLLVSATVWMVTPSNVALHKPTRSSPPAYNTAPEGAVDGEKNGSFGFHTVEEEFPWLMVDLGRPYNLVRVKVFGRGDGYNDQSIPLALEVSDDGISFKKIAGRTEPFSEADPWSVEVAPAVARFVRLRTERRAVLVLSELEVYGRAKR